MKRLIPIVMLAMLIVSFALVHAAPPKYEVKGSVNVAPASPVLTAVDPYAYPVSTDVMPARPFLYTVDKNGITITRFNDNKVVGTWPWPKPPEVIYTVLPNGSFTGLTPPAEWEPVAMTVSYPTEKEIANRVKEIPDLTPPPTYVYVVMAHSGYEWRSNSGHRDTIVKQDPPNPATDSSMLIQIDVSDPSFSTSLDPANPVPPHIGGAILGHRAGQPVYDRATGNVYVGNMPSTSLPANLASFVSVIRRIPPEVAEVEAEVPGISMPVIRCGPQHPETGIPAGKPQAFACYDPSGTHPIDDNEHVGAYGELKRWDTTKANLYQEQYVWEFRNLPTWLNVHLDKVSGEPDGILYGTPPATGEWIAEARVHNLGDEFGVFSEWTPIQLYVRPTAEYLPIKAQFAAGVPVAYPLEGTGSCALTGAPAWVDVKTVTNGCIVMGRAPIDGEYYNFSMPGFTPAGYPTGLVFSGNVFGGYEFVPLPQGVGISGMAWHQVSKVADPSTETPVLSLEFIGVDPTTGQLYQILPPPGKPQPPNVRPPETALTLAAVSAMGTPLTGSGFGEVAVEADRDIYVAAAGAVIKVSGGTATPISLPGMQGSSLSLDSDLRTAIPGVEPGQVDHGVLWVAGTGKVAVVDTDSASVAQSFNVTGASSVSVDFGTRWAYVAAGSSSVAIFGPEPAGSTRPPMKPRIWSAEEFTWNLGQTAEVRLMATGDPIPALFLLGGLPPGLTFADNGDGTARIYGTPTAPGGGGGGGGDPEGGEAGGDYSMVIRAQSTQGTYAQTFGITVQAPPKITSANTATFVVGAASSFTVTGTGWPTPIFYILDPTAMPTGVQLIDNEDGTASLVGTPTTPGTYVFTIHATTDCPPDADQVFTLTVLAAGTQVAPVFTSANTTTWATIGAPFPPDPFIVSTIGSPTPTLSAQGLPCLPTANPAICPFGVTFTDNGNATATLAGTPWYAGTYTINITASNTAGTSTQTFKLIVEANTTILSATPESLSFAYTFGGTLPAAQSVKVITSGDVLPIAVVTTAAWLAAIPVYGTADPPDLGLEVSVDPSGLAPGTYTASVMVLSAGTEGPPATVAVALTVNALPVMSVTPRMLSFEYTLSDRSIPQAQTMSLETGGKPLSYRVSTDAAWLVVTPRSGTTPGNLSVSANASQLRLGTYYATLTITSDAANGPQRIPVVLMKNATKMNFSIKVSADVGSGPEGLAVNLTTHQVFINTSHEAAEPGSAAGNEASGTEVETAPGPAEGQAVFRFDPLTGAVTGRTIVHSEGEYVAVNSKTNRVYHASQGTSEIVVIDGLTSKIVAYIPLYYPGDTYTIPGWYMPYQIAIDEAQNLIYVGAKSPEVEPNGLIPDANGKYGCRAIRELPSDEANPGPAELDCWHPGKVFVIDGNTNQLALYNGKPMHFVAGDDPEGVVFAAATGKVYASNEDDGTVTVAKGAKRNRDGSITPPKVLSTIIKGVPVPGWWQPTCDEKNYCGERGKGTNLSLWPNPSRCNGIDDEAQEADKMTVDPMGNVYIIDDRYRVAKIDGWTDKVVKVLEIEGFDCERSVPDGSNVLFRNTANNIAFSAGAPWVLYVTSEQDTVAVIDPFSMTLKQIITIPGAVHLDAIATDPKLNRVYITDEELGVLFILEKK